MPCSNTCSAKTFDFGRFRAGTVMSDAGAGGSDRVCDGCYGVVHRFVQVS